MTEQPPEGAPPRKRFEGREGVMTAYRLTISLVTAREDIRECIHAVIEDNPGITAGEMNEILGNTALMLTEYVRTTGDALDRVHGGPVFEDAFRRGIHLKAMGY